MVLWIVYPCMCASHVFNCLGVWCSVGCSWCMNICAIIILLLLWLDNLSRLSHASYMYNHFHCSILVLVGIDTFLLHAPLSVFMFGVLVVRWYNAQCHNNINGLLLDINHYYHRLLGYCSLQIYSDVCVALFSILCNVLDLDLGPEVSCIL